MDLKKTVDWDCGIASNTFFPEDEKDLHNYLKIKIIKIFYFRKWIKYSFQDKGYSGKIIKLGKGFRGINFTQDKKHLICMRKTLKKEYNFALKNNISGLSFCHAFLEI